VHLKLQNGFTKSLKKLYHMQTFIEELNGKK
jgi:hypothetical protein